MKNLANALGISLMLLATAAFAGDGYRVTGKSGIMYFVSIADSVKDNEDVYRSALAEVCAGKAVCQVQFWIGAAPSGFPMTDAQVNSKLVHWQQNQNTGRRVWLVKCDATDLFKSGRSCM